MFRKRKTQQSQDHGEVSTNFDYPYRLSFYSIQPANNITIDEFENWAVARLRVLSELERYSNGETRIKDMVKDMTPVLNTHLPLHAQGKKAKELDQERMKDHYSHYILRLCFCRDPANQAKFVSYEKKLFKLRFELATQQERRDFVASLPLGLTKLTSDELLHVPKRFQGESMVKVDWTSVPDLVASRRVYLREGFAYIDEAQQAQFIANEFAKSLTQGLIHLSRLVTRLNEDDRLLPILDHMQDFFALGNKRDTANELITAQDIYQFDKENKLPLCMSTMHRLNDSENYAKHSSRTFFTQFLKNTGLSYDGAIDYWKNIFTGVNEDYWNKNQFYYSFKHSYGLTGSKINYEPPSCKSLSTVTPSAKDACTCPFTQKPEKVASYLRERGITKSEDLQYIKDKAQNKMYHLSCTRVFELTQHQEKVEIITSANDYFERATRDAMAKRREAMSDSPKGTPSKTPRATPSPLK